MGTTVIMVIGTVIASNGLWAFISKVWEKKHSNETAQAQMLKGLGHDRICYLGEEYIKRGSITVHELENIDKYLYQPYKALGGNGTAKKIMDDVKNLPIVHK